VKNVYRLAVRPFPGSHLYMPEGPSPLARVVLLHGSEGGIPGHHSAAMARFLAENGYAALAFTWCASPTPAPEIPSNVTNVDLERTCEAIRWLQGKSPLDGKKMALYGVSRGAEQALILASMQGDPSIPSMNALAVHASTSYVVPASGWDYGQPVVAKAWCWHGQHLEPLQPIPIEKFTSPVFLSHGCNDPEYEGSLWYADRSRELEGRLRTKRPDDCVVETQYLPGEGHRLSDAGMRLHQERLLAFFRRHLQ
jgi:dienelactone hydrolase